MTRPTGPTFFLMEWNGSILVRALPGFIDAARIYRLTTVAIGGGMPRSYNRTKWPVRGGAVAVQPGWFPGHSTALIYVNLGFGEVPENMSHPVVPAFQISGPTNNPYPGTFCLPQVPLPANISVQPGDYATIQVVETAKHGAALYNVCTHFSPTWTCGAKTLTVGFLSVSTSNLPKWMTPRFKKSLVTTASIPATYPFSICTQRQGLGTAPGR